MHQPQLPTGLQASAIGVGSGPAGARIAQPAQQPSPAARPRPVKPGLPQARRLGLGQPCGPDPCRQITVHA
ncbi:MAG: hypothetical protein EON47_24065 [Acetobacteraceae bacterium]|nr:MAG: hypothetical protein EON47_24065 [Acetobacteraceae bacterium]